MAEGGKATETQPTAVDTTLLRKKATVQGSVTRAFNTGQRLLDGDTPISVLQSAADELQVKFRKFEEVCEEILQSLDEKDEKYAEITSVLEKKQDDVMIFKGEVARREERKKERSQDTTQELIRSVKASLSVPKADIMKFDGSPKDYAAFMAYLETHVEAVIDDSTQRLTMMIQACVGLAHDAVSTLLQCKDRKAAYERGKTVLKELFGSNYQVSRAVIEECTTGPPIKGHDKDGMRKLVVAMTRAEITIQESGDSGDLSASSHLVKIYQRLPKHLQHRWNDKVVELQEKGKRPQFEHLRKLIEHYVKSQDNEYASSVSVKKPAESKQSAKTVLSINESKMCVICKQDHYLNQCDNFRGMNLKERHEVVMKNQLCRNCLHSGHISTKCKRSSLCKKCPHKHNDLLHDDEFKSRGPSGSVASDSTASQSNSSTVGIACVDVVIEGKDSFIKCKAIVDPKSTCNMCTKRLAKRLQLNTMHFDTNLNVATGMYNVKGEKIGETKVYDKDMNDYVVVQDILTMDSIPVAKECIFTNDDLVSFSHLKDVKLPLHSGKDEIDLLIGSGVPKAFHKFEERKGRDDEPYACRLTLGWEVVGSKKHEQVSGSHSYAVSNVESAFFVSRNNSIDGDIQTVFQTDFADGTLFSEKRGMSVDDYKAQKCVESSMSLSDGQFCVGLPWKSDPQNLPSCKEIVLKRLNSLKKRMCRDETFHKNYSEEMQKYIDQGYLEISTNSDTLLRHYIPHHAVFHPRKGSIRIVWDCALSLNDFLFEGPDLLNAIAEVLIRFRRFPYVVCSDIKKMYLSVKVPESDRGALRILWWKDGNVRSDPAEYRATVHMYGAKSSGFVANYCVRKLADEVTDETVSQMIKDDFYVDDQVSSFKDEREAAQVVNRVKEVLIQGGFKLTKFVSNSRLVANSLPKDDLIASTEKMFDVPGFKHSVLGVEWEVMSDSLRFPVGVPEETSPSKRSFLSAAAKVFDPLGMMSPATLPLRATLQEKSHLSWSESDADLEQRWQQVCEVMQLLLSMKVPRCYVPQRLSQVVDVSLHGFCDASNTGYAFVVYVRQVDVSGEVAVSFVIGKSKVVPKFKGHIPQATIPKLELNAAAKLVRLVRRVKDCIDVDASRCVYWCDSMAVLSSIDSTTQRFPVYWSNRLAVIHEFSNEDEWRFVPTKKNPADVGSRGVSAKKFTKDMEFWIYGPEFLKQDENQWPIVEKPKPVPEIVLATAESHAKHSLLSKVIEYYSDLSKLVKVIARLIRFMRATKRQDRQPLSVEDLKQSLMSLIRYEQQSIVKSSIKRLRPISDCLGVLRVQSRLCQAKHLSDDVKFPIILPKNSHLTDLIIGKEHHVSAHAGPRHVLVQLRQKYWVIDGIKSVKRVVSQCRKCREENARSLQQQMSCLPDERITPSYPFQCVGLDYFGPFYCKVGRRRFKRYGCIFVCMASRAVHLECVNSLESSAFLCALMRFVSRRGMPSVIYSDNATNFRGSQDEIKEIRAKNEESLCDFALNKGIEWKFHPPLGSHHGGHYERLIRSVRRTLRGVTSEQEMSDDNLSTVLCEVEKVLNDRPITALSNDPNDELPLTPNLVLLLRGNSCQSMFSENYNGPKLYHKQAQFMADVFWKRWLREYVPMLQTRQKWLDPKRSLKVGDLVLMTGEGYQRGQWPIAKVIEVCKEKDNLVRTVIVKCKSGTKERPVTKLALLEAAE